MFREFVKACLGLVGDAFRGRAKLIAENALLRQQAVVLKRGSPRPRLKPRDRWTIAAITKLFPSLVGAVPIVRPDTVIRPPDVDRKPAWLPPVRPTAASAVRSVPFLGGLHHEYTVVA